MLVVVHSLAKGLERRSRSANTLENIYYVIRATQIQMPDGIMKGTTDCEADDFLCGQWRACTPIVKHKKTTEAKRLLSVTFLQWGSNGEAEARIPLKIILCYSRNPNTNA